MKPLTTGNPEEGVIGMLGVRLHHVDETSPPKCCLARILKAATSLDET